MMGIWTETIEKKASIIQSQMLEARRLALINDLDVELISRPYLNLLHNLYSEEFPFANLADSSDLVARFTGPAVDKKDPAVSTVISVFSDIRCQIRSIAKSVAGLASLSQVNWPSHLDPQLSGIARGSFIVGVSIPNPNDENETNQLEIEGVSDHIFKSVLTAVQSLATVAKYVTNTEIDTKIIEDFPDPAVRDTILVAAKKLSPSGKKGIDSVSFTAPNSDYENEPKKLTKKSRIIISSSLNSYVNNLSETGIFEGIVRQIDLDARRFEVRNVFNIGSIRCAYSDIHEHIIRKSLDAKIRIYGTYAKSPSGKPRMMAVQNIEIIELPPKQLSI